MNNGDASSGLGIDFREVAEFCRSETFGDWYRDPWGWPEFDDDFSGILTLDDIGVERSGKQYRLVPDPTFHTFERPKSYLGVRPASIQDATTRLAFSAACMRAARKGEAELPDWVYGFRARKGKFEKSSVEWQSYLDSHESIETSEYAAVADITSFFASIDSEALSNWLAAQDISPWATDIIRNVLSAHSNLAHRSGLPQRNAAASLVANFALREVDSLLTALVEEGRLKAARRWVDDISFEGEEGDLFATVVDLQERLRTTGLEINLAKTSIDRADARMASLRREWAKLIHVIDEEFEGDYGTYQFYDAEALLEAEKQVLDDPSQASQTTAKRVLKSLSHYRVFDRADEWLAASHELPHVADALSRFNAEWISDSLDARSKVADWLTSKLDEWPHLPWVRAQFALSLPSDETPDAIIAIFRQWLRESRNAQQLAVAVQRLGRTNRPVHRNDLLKRLSTENDPFLLRILAIGLVTAGGDHKIAEQALARHGSNRLTLRAVRYREWNLRIVQDFDRPADSEGGS